MKISPLPFSPQSKSKYSKSLDLSITIFEDDLKKSLVPPPPPSALSVLLRIGTSLRFLPFDWDYHEHRLKLNDSVGRTYFICNLAFVFGYATFKFYLSLRKEFLEGPNKIHSVVECLFFVLFALALLLTLNNAYHAEDIVAFMNTYLWRVRIEIAQYFDTQNTIHLLETFWKGYLRTLHLSLLLAVPLFVRGKFPSSSASPEVESTSSVFLHKEEVEEVSPIKFLYYIFLFMDLYSLYTFLIIMGFYTFFIVDATLVIEKLSQSMRCRISKISSLSASTSRLEELKFVQKCCNEIHITVASYKAIMESLVLPVLLSVTTMISSLGLFTVIKFYGELGIIFSMILSLAETFCISLTSLGLCKVSRMCSSNEFVQRELCTMIPTKVRKEQKIMMASIQPLRLRIGSFFLVSRQTATDFLETLCSWLTTLLLTYGCEYNQAPCSALN